MSNKNESRLLYNSKHSPCFKEDLTAATISQDTITQELSHPINATRPITEFMTAEDDLESTIITASKANHDKLLELHQSK